MLDALGAEANHGLVACSHPSVFEGFFRGFVVVQVAQDDAGSAHDQFAWCVVFGDLFVLGGHDSGFEAGDKGSG